MDFSSFPCSKYTAHYINLINSRMFQSKTKFKTEKHHIFPRSIYGENNFTINLTHREHFIAHLLLSKMYENTEHKYSVANALLCFKNMTNTCNGRPIINSRFFEKARELSNENMPARVKMSVWNVPEIRERLTAHRQEYWGNEENRNAQSEKRKQHFSDPENLAKQTEINREIASRPEWKKQRSTKQKELSSNPEYVKHRIDAMNTPESRQKSKINQRASLDSMSPSERSEKFGTRNRGNHWYTDGVNNISTKPGTEPQGWVRGRTLKKASQ